VGTGDQNIHELDTEESSGQLSEEGPRVFGSYELLTSIGQGGMGEIFLGRRSDDKDTTPLVALKVLPPKMSQNHAAVAMFMDEASIMAQIEHPNVLQVFEFGKELGCYFLVMEYLQGQSLATVLFEARKRDRRLSYEEVVAMGVGAARGLSGAHGAKGKDGVALEVIHRDVTPQNIFITYEGCPKLIDFGIAHASERLTVTSTGVFKGKAAYMSPEQIDMDDVDARTDVFALGVCLWEMVAGERLFFRESQMESMEAVHASPIGSPTNLAGKPDEDLDKIILRALERDLSRRTASASELQKELAAYLSSKTSTQEDKIVTELMSELFEEYSSQERKLLHEISTVEETDTFRLKSISGMAPVANNSRAVSFSGRVEAAETNEWKTDLTGVDSLEPEIEHQATARRTRPKTVRESVEALSSELAPLEERQAQERRASGEVISVDPNFEQHNNFGRRKDAQFKWWLAAATIILAIALGFQARKQSSEKIEAKSISGPAK